jgi:hypothetical protein
VTLGPNGATPTSTVVGIANRRLESWVGTFDSVSIGDETIRNVKLRVADLFGNDKAAETGSRISRAVEGSSLIIGFDFLLSHRVLVLAKEHKLLFTYNGGPLFQFVAPDVQPAGIAEASGSGEDPKSAAP